MTKYILHGGYTREKKDLNNNFFKEIVKDLKGKIKILFVYFASEESDYEEKLEQEKDNFLNNSENKDLEFEIADRNNFIEQIKNADVIYIRGGDTFKLLETLKLYPKFSEAIETKVVVGSSAGAYVLSKHFYSRTRERIINGLGILPIAIACHYKGKQETLELLKGKAKDLEIVLLDDFEHKVIIA